MVPGSQAVARQAEALLKQALRHFIDFRGEVIVRRATYDLNQARARAHAADAEHVARGDLEDGPQTQALVGVGPGCGGRARGAMVFGWWWNFSLDLSLPV